VNDDTTPIGPERRPGHGRAELRQILTRVRGQVRLSRGRGALALDTLLASVRDGTPLGDTEELGLSRVIESLVFAVEDAEAAARRPRFPGR
jgi:hypothetical protein